MLITSVNNNHIKELVRLKEKKYRDDTNKFLIETEHLVLEAFKEGIVEELILEDGKMFPLDVETLYVSSEVMNKLSQTKSNPGVMALCHKIEEKDYLGDKILVLDNIQDPGNLGTIIRSAVAFNIDTIVLSNNTVDLYNSKVVRSNQGMMFHINIIRRDIVSFVNELKKDNYKIIGTRVTDGVDVKEMNKCSHYALIIGNEGKGISKGIEELCDEYLYIRMNDNCESLNASVAASIIMYELDNK